VSIEDRLLAAAAAANERIENCHVEVACPKCGAPVGERCVRAHPVRSWAEQPPVLHPHRERWTRVVPAR
jgi:hypothetical protein